MKILCSIIIFIILSGCINDTAKKTIVTKTSSKQLEDKTKRIEDINDSIGNVEYLAYGDVIYDTIYLDSLRHLIGIHNYQIIDNQVYLAYSIQSIGKTARKEPYETKNGIFINSCDTSYLPLITGKWIDMEQIKFNDSATYIDGYLSLKNRLDFEKSYLIPDSDSILYLYVKLPEESDFKTHILIEKIDNYFEKRFEISTTDYNLSFEIENNSILTCEYFERMEDTTFSNEFKYDIINKLEIK